MNKQFGTFKIYCKAFKGREDIISWDVLEIEQEQILKLTFMSKNSPFRQGVRIAIDTGNGFVEVNGLRSKGMEFWEDNAPKEVIIKCISNKGLVSIYNIWDEGRGRQSLSYTSGMLLEEKQDKRIYYCNDFGYETNFDKLVFSIEKPIP